MNTARAPVASFKELLKAKRPDVEFCRRAMGQRWASWRRGATLSAIMNSKPDAIFNVTFARRPGPAWWREGQSAGHLSQGAGGVPCSRASPNTWMC
jgi:hypothetical protein